MSTDNKKKIRSMRNVFYMLKLIYKASPDRIFVSTIKRIIESVFYVFFFIFLMQYIFDSLEKGLSFNHVFWFLTLLAVGHIGIHVLSSGYDYYLSRNDPKVFGSIYGKVIKKATVMPLYKFESPQYYDEYARALEEAEKRAEEVVRTFSNVCADLASIVTIALMVMKWDATILLFSIIPIINAALVNKVRSTLIMKKTNAINRDKRRADYCKRLFYERQYAGEIRLFSIKKLFFDIHEESTKNIEKTSIYYEKRIALIDIWDNFLVRVVMLLLCSVYATYQIMVLNHLSIGIFVSMMMAVLSLSSNFNNLIANFAQLTSQGKLIESIKKFFEEESEEEAENQVDLNRKFEQLTLKNVSFTYTGSERPVLKNINLTISKGEKIALVGHNGAGKTSLVKVLMGLYKPTEGEICFNDTIITEYALSSYRKVFSTVLQDFQVYALSIATNIIMREAVTIEDENKVLRALRRAGLEEKVSSMKKGIYTTLTREFDDEGVILSGGEKQKLAVARAFANEEAEVLILDEPSSALDPISEFNIYENMMQAAENKTVIFISHRLSTAKMADKIIVVEDGEIIEYGNHDYLMSTNGKYASMFRLQSQNYIEQDILKEQTV